MCMLLPHTKQIICIVTWASFALDFCWMEKCWSFSNFNSTDAKVYGLIITVNSYAKTPTFSWIVLCGDDVLVPDDLLGGVQRHLVELFNLGDPSLVVWHLNISEKGFVRFVSSSMNHQIICPLCHDGLPFKHSRWPNVGYTPHSQSHPMNTFKRHTSPSQLAFACFETSTNVNVFSSTQILYANQNGVVCLCHLS